jgi:hypothetical protein
MVALITALILGQAKVSKPAPAVFSDPQVRRTVEQSRSAFSKLGSAGITITTDGESKTYALGNGKLAGKQRGAQWIFQNKSLVLQCSKGLFKGRMGPYNVNAWLSKVGSSPEVVPIQILAKKNPVDALVIPGARVRKVGAMQEHGVWIDLIEVKTSRLKVSMGIRRDNHLFANLAAVNTDKNGETLFSSERSFTWSKPNMALFKVGAGKTPKPIKSLAK